MTYHSDMLNTPEAIGSKPVRFCAIQRGWES
jgi:hypothetical protein